MLKLARAIHINDTLLDIYQDVQSRKLTHYAETDKANDCDIKLHLKQPKNHDIYYELKVRLRAEGITIEHQSVDLLRLFSMVRRDVWAYATGDLGMVSAEEYEMDRSIDHGLIGDIH
jgi:hypothetical protein